MASKPEEARSRMIESLNTIFYPVLAFLFTLLVFIQVNFSLSPTDSNYVYFCELIIVFLGVSVLYANKYAIKLFHYVFAIQLFVAPLFIRASVLLAFNVIVIVTSLALRAQYGECVLCIYEGRINDSVLDFAESILNFNFVFFCAAAVYLWMLISRDNSKN